MGGMNIDLTALMVEQFGPWAETVEDVRMGLKHRSHPLTCPNRSDGKHYMYQGQIGVLVPTVRGWICQSCDYSQPLDQVTR